MTENRVKVSSIVKNQLPAFVREDFPLVAEFLTQYYQSQEYQGAPKDLIENIDRYLKIDNLTNLSEETTLTQDISFFETEIRIDPTTIKGFPEINGLVKIDDEIIHYTSLTRSIEGLEYPDTLSGCSRGFSGVTSYDAPERTDKLVFTQTEAQEHSFGATVINLNALFLKEFLKKIKKQFAPGFEDRLSDQINHNVFIKQSNDFYTSKGTDQSFEILFRALYGEDVSIIKPRDYLIKPSNAGYRVNLDIVAELVEGNPYELLNQTLNQDEYPEYQIPAAYGSISKVEKISFIDGEYYRLSLDYDYDKDIILKGSVFGSFSVHPKTTLTLETSIGSSFIDVDSTVGFPSSGTLIIRDDRGVEITVTYSNKTNTQFLDVQGMTVAFEAGSTVSLDVYCFGYSREDSSLVKLRIRSVLSDLKIEGNTYYFSPNEKIKIKSLGIITEDSKKNEWFLNIPNRYEFVRVTRFIRRDEGRNEFIYNLRTPTKNVINIGDKINISNNFVRSAEGTVIAIVDDNTFTASFTQLLNQTQTYTLRKRIIKAFSEKYPNISNFTTNIQNTYLNLANDILISSSSIPSYYNGSDQVSLNAFNKSYAIKDGAYIQEEILDLSASNPNLSDHELYTGDSVYYSADQNQNFLGLNPGIYFVKRVDSKSIKLSRSRSNLYQNEFVTFTGEVTGNRLNAINFYNKSLYPQNILREIKEPVDFGGNNETKPGPIGILINGVEILNYKSQDSIFYGGIERIDVTSPGSNYDVINPPVLEIDDPIGTGATGSCSVIGSLKRIDIKDPGFDYTSTPIITITGGNGTGAVAEATLKDVEHKVFFNALSGINTTNNTIKFSTYHRFRDYERVVYNNYGQNIVSNLVANSDYYVSVVDSTTIKLHLSEEDANVGINTITLEPGAGSHELKSYNLKKIVAGISVINSGSGYCNKKRVVSGINTALDLITIENHGYLSGEKVVYKSEGTPISGLTTNTEYIVDSFGPNSFKLCEVGLGNTSEYFYFDNKEYVNLTSTGSGVNYFNYPEITVSIKGNIGINTLTDQDLSIFEAQIQPVFRGEIESVDVSESGTSYGTPEIINFIKQPNFVLKSGKNAQIQPVVSNGSIVDVLILSSGSEYNSPPDLIVRGDGSGAKLTPIVVDGKLTEVRVIKGGSGYKTTTLIDVVPAGSGCNLSAEIQKWTINFVEKNIHNIGSDDGFLEVSTNRNDQLQYYHAYAPRKLRESVYSRSIDNVKVETDIIKNSAGTEITSRNHSPIIGWAYDGNPIYGPYGYTEKSGGTVKLLSSGYTAVRKSNRPSEYIDGKLTYPLGFFVEDYEYFGGSDLDEHNGRFCVTPDFPNGTYAYFATIESRPTEGGLFNNYRKPKFPYIIGNTFRSKPNEFNFSPLSNQNDIDLNKTDWFRNTSFLRNSYYDYIFNPNNFKNHNSTIKSTSVGSIESVGILTGGVDYKVNDSIIFNNLGSGGINANATVERVFGKQVSSISVATTYISDVQLLPSSGGNIIALTDYPHNLSNNNLTIISGINTSTSDFYGSYSIGVPSYSYILTTDLSDSSVTGITTYINLSGNLSFPYLREDDILIIENEKVKVLNIDKEQSRVRINREYEGTIGAAHTATTLIYNDSRIFTFTSNVKGQNNFAINKKLYFNPVETVGLGTISGVGIGTTLSFSNPGVGVTQKFVPTKSLYIPNHGLNTGDLLVYSSGIGSPIGVSTDGITSFNLTNLQQVYAAKINDDLIGISTVKVYLNSNGDFVGISSSADSILYFTGIGTDVYHSFATAKDNVLKCLVSSNVVTVSTASTHNLNLRDNIIVDVNPSIGSSIVVKYDDYNRRIVINPKNIISSDINLEENSIYIQNHQFKDGDKVIYTSQTPSAGLENNKIYYVYKFTEDKIKLCDSRYKVFLDNPVVVDITSTSSGTISPINPPINLYKNSSVRFDLSDPSLSVLRDLQRYSAFEFNLYKDSGFNFIFDSSSETREFEVVRSSGRIGIDANASVTINIKDQTPSSLYYNLDPINNSIISGTSKSERIVDTEVDSNNKVNLLRSKYSGSYNITGITSNTFDYNLPEVPERLSYSNTEAKITYDTSSLNEKGSITKIRVNNKGINYKILPGISTISTQTGSGAILEPQSKSIGKILSTKIDDIGFNYPTDFTLRPIVNVPEILQMEQLASFERIQVLSYGKNYLVPPRIVVIDGFRKNVINDTILKFDFRSKELKIEKNTFGISNVDPIFIPVNNSNGVGIGTISFNPTTKNVTVRMSVGFSTANSFPFSIGDRVLIENIAITGAGKGYNSSQYNYELFTLVDVDENIGGIGSVTYNLSNYLLPGENPGTFNPEITSGRIIAEKDFPRFKATLKKNNFIVGEEVTTTNGYDGVVESWNNNIELLKVSSDSDFAVGETVTGKTSNTQGIIRNKIDFDAYINLDSDSLVYSGWEYETGILNNSTQRVHDNNYYQDFSYSVKSKVPYDTWSNTVNTLNHTAGFLKFSDLIVESSPLISIAQTRPTGKPIIAENATETLVDIIEEVNTNCTFNFDLVTETSFSISAETLSNQIIFNNKALMDYSESIGNRVLLIDDLSPQFNSTPRPTRFSVVDNFDANFHYRKYFAFIRDKVFSEERQIIAVSLLHDGSNGFLNQYSKIHTYRDLGSFDFKISGTEGQLLYYPIDYSVNDYDISVLAYSVGDSFTGIGTVSLGDTVNIVSYSTEIPSGISTTIVGIASTYRSSKLLVLVNDVDETTYQSNEISVVFDGTNVSILEYGQLTNDNLVSSSGLGIGTYFAYYDSLSSTVNIDFIPNAGIGTSLIANSVCVSIANTSSVSVGTTVLKTSTINSVITSIASTSTPIPTQISEFVSPHKSAYCIVSVEDLTNNEYRMSEVISITDDNNVYFTEYGIIETGSGIGTIGISTDSNSVKLYFTPNPNIDAEVRVLQNALNLQNDEVDLMEINLNNSEIGSGYGDYTGTEKSVRKEFELYHRGNKIFERTFNGNSANVVDVSANTIFLPNHFFVTGEKLTYTPNSSNPIGIASTYFVGVGTTSLLPSTVYAIKVDETKIKLARSAQDALLENPIPLDLTNVGLGTNHKFVTDNQNTRVLITIDNLIQSPIVSTSVTTSLASSITSFDFKFDFVGVTSFYGGDLIKIGNEIMKINTVGFGSTTTVLVDRPWMGTSPSSHAAGSLITKVRGNYNIVNNTIHFIDAPKGNIPLSSTTNPPNERDWTGITTSAKFHGRTFIRSGVRDSINDTYSTNYTFDDISNQFIGTVDDFNLKVNSQDITGIATDNAIVLINNIFQEPQGDQIITKDYILEEKSGITSITFTGSPASVLSDPNSASVPLGGVIISVGSTGGLGYQPLVSAGATAIVSGLGTISSFAIGTTGSGYRGSSYYEIETVVNSSVGIGSTVIFLSNQNGVFEKLNLSTSNAISVGDIRSANIVSVGNTFVRINVSAASTVGIGISDKAVIRLNSPIAGIVNVGVQTTYKNQNYETYIGFTTIVSGHISTSITITNPGFGFTTSDPPIVLIDSPLPYSNIPLVYSSSSNTGIGSEAKVDIIVGQGSSVIDFEITNTGYAYGNDEILTVPIGGLIGIPTDPTIPFSEFKLNIERTFYDEFSGWNIGQLQVLDSFERFFDSSRKVFQLRLNNNPVTIRSKKGSNISVRDTLLIFINDILQVPGESYQFNGGSFITFTEAPKGPVENIPNSGDKCKVIFYRGTSEIDVIDVDVVETVKEGDDLTIDSNKNTCANSVKQEERVVTLIESTDSVYTTPYNGVGIINDPNCLRPVTWCKQTDDVIINGKVVSKARSLYEPLVNPTTYIIQPVGSASTQIFVESIKTFFDPSNEVPGNVRQKTIEIISQNELVGAAATVTVSVAGTISQFNVSTGGKGYTVAPDITISSPVGFGTTATAVSSITAGIVTSISITNSGTEYSSENPPSVLISPPTVKVEKNTALNYEGDFGVIVGVTTTSVGVASTGLVFDLFVPLNSYIRNSTITGAAATNVSGIKTGYYFAVHNSNIGTGFTSLYQNGSVLGIGTQYLDNVYQVADTSLDQINVPGIGVTFIKRVTVSVESFDSFVGTSTTSFYGEYSWGKIDLGPRNNNLEFDAYTTNGSTGISTSAIVRRVSPLKSSNYTS